MAVAAKVEKTSGNKRAGVVPVYVYEDSDPPVAFTQSQRNNDIIPAAVAAADAYTGKTWDTRWDDYNVDQLSDHSFRVGVLYNQREFEGGGGFPPPSILPAGVLSHQFNFRAESYSSEYALGMVQKAPADAPASELLLRDPSLGKKRKTLIKPPPVHHTLEYSKPVNAGENLSNAYIDAIELAVGRFNSEEFQGKPAGTVFLAGAQGTRRTTGEFTLAFEIAYAPLKTVTVGEGANAKTLSGVCPFSHIRVDLQDQFVPAANKVLAVPRAVYELQVWEFADLETLLDLPSS